MTMTLDIKTITRQITSFFEFHPLVHFISAFELENAIPWGPPFSLFYGLQNTHLHDQDYIFNPVNIDTIFHRKFANFWYVPFGIVPYPIWMFHSCFTNNKINQLHEHERCMRPTYGNKTTVFKELLHQDKSVSIHSRTYKYLLQKCLKCIE